MGCWTSWSGGSGSDTHWGEAAEYVRRLYKNVGTPDQPIFETSDEYHGAPYTEQFQQCDAVRQNGVRTVDWNNDGKPT